MCFGWEIIEAGITKSEAALIAFSCTFSAVSSVNRVLNVVSLEPSRATLESDRGVSAMMIVSVTGTLISLQVSFVKSMIMKVQRVFLL